MGDALIKLLFLLSYLQKLSSILKKRKGGGVLIEREQRDRKGRKTQLEI